MQTRGIEVKRIAGALGAEVSGVDLSKPLSDELAAELRRAWLEHLVLFFRNQDLSPEQYLAFARRFGKPVEYPFVKGIEGFPEIIEVKKLEHETVNFGGIWHSDTAYLDEPPMASMLLAREIPPYGGDTLFANMYLAYETLSSGLKKLLDG
ncbi:MAG TPA: TauD/TfdA family dioxygenase, partial [Steroidobacteraceae bacterium]|nr:TauD/TfdA family dioxygenase [Steroidobacteraceae bacterium]